MALTAAGRHPGHMPTPFADVKTFAALTLGITVAVIALAVALDSEELTFLAVLVPSSVAVLLTRRSGRLARELFGAKPSAWPVVASLVIFPILGALAVFGSGVGWKLPDVGIDTVIAIIVIAFGEELGWRGFAYPRVRSGMGAAPAGLAVGALWAVWHLPGYAVGVGVAEGASVWLFGFWVIAASLVFAAFIEISPRSTWYAIALHAGANATFAVMPITSEAADSSGPLLWMAGLAGLAGVGLLSVTGRRARTGAARVPH